MGPVKQNPIQRTVRYDRETNKKKHWHNTHSAMHMQCLVKNCRTLVQYCIDSRYYKQYMW